MTSRQRMATLLMSLFVAIAVAAGVMASPAFAAFTDEPAGLFTICDNKTCNNTYDRLSYNIDFQDNGVCVDVAPWMDNRTSGAVNRVAGTRVELFRLLGCSDELDIPNAGNDMNYGDTLEIQAGAYINNKLSSFRVWND